MAYLFPPSRTFGNVALVAGTATATILAAPGAGFRYRIVGGLLWINRTATGLVDVLFEDIAGVDIIWEARGMSVAGGMSNFPLIIPEPGQQLPDNTGLRIRALSSAATGNAGITVYYFIDTVS